MLLIAHETEADAQASARALQALGHHARKLMGECVEHQEVRRTKLSKAAEQLSDAGFLFIHDVGSIWLTDFRLQPSLRGEEALEALELMEEQNELPKKMT